MITDTLADMHLIATEETLAVLVTGQLGFYRLQHGWPTGQPGRAALVATANAAPGGRLWGFNFHINVPRRPRGGALALSRPW